MTLHSLLQSIKIDGHLGDPNIVKIESHLTATQGPRNNPWYIKAAIAFGAWVAAICFLAFIGIFGAIIAKSFLFIIGIPVIVIATLIRAILKFEFTNQLALASSLAGHCMVLFGVYDIGEHSRHGEAPMLRVAIASIFLCVIMYPLFRDPVHRFLSCFLSQMMLLIWLASADHPRRIYFLITDRSDWNSFFLCRKIADWSRTGDKRATAGLCAGCRADIFVWVVGDFS